MAGGRGEGRSRLTLAERLEVTPETARHARGGTGGPAAAHTTLPVHPTYTPGPGADYGETADYRDPPDGPRHVWVSTEDGVVPGLLVEWRKPKQLPWEGRVIRAARHGDDWRLVEEWRNYSSIQPL